MKCPRHWLFEEKALHHCRIREKKDEEGSKSLMISKRNGSFSFQLKGRLRLTFLFLGISTRFMQ